MLMGGSVAQWEALQPYRFRSLGLILKWNYVLCVSFICFYPVCGRTSGFLGPPNALKRMQVIGLFTTWIGYSRCE